MIFLIILVILFLFFPFLPFFITNLHNFGFYSFLDLKDYFRFKKYNNFTGFGNVYMYCASGSQVFGSGKTASMINDVYSIYNKYNGKLVYDEKEGKFVRQNIHIISNVEMFGVDYIPFKGVNQFIDIEKYGFGRMDITLYVLDESGAIFNSRQFKDNISTDMLNRLLQSRKNKCCLYMTSQRFIFTDKLLREISSKVIECRKIWRVMRNVSYDPLELEYALNPSIIKSQGIKYWFATSASFARYNTFQLVEKLNKDYTPLTDEEVIARRGSSVGSLENASRVKRKYRPHKQL